MRKLQYRQYSGLSRQNMRFAGSKFKESGDERPQPRASMPTYFSFPSFSRCLSNHVAPVVAQKQKEDEMTSQDNNVITCTEAESDVIASTMANLLR